MAACLAQSDAPSPRMLTVGRTRSPAGLMTSCCQISSRGLSVRGAALGEPTFGPDFECGDARLAILDHPGSDQFRSKSQVQTDNKPDGEE